MSMKLHLAGLMLFAGLAMPGLGSRANADSVVVFNEIMYHPAETQPDNEWIELHNQMAVDIDLSGWSVKGGIDYTFPEGTFMPGGSYLVIARLPAQFSELDQVFGPFSGQLSNSGESLRLESASGRLMDSVTFNDKAPWPIAPDGAGTSLAKKHRDMGSAKAGNWLSSLQVDGTPGQENFPVIDLRPIRTDLIDNDSFWKYYLTGDLGTQWSMPGYNTQSFTTGQAGFSYGLDAGSGTPEPIPTLYSTGVDDAGQPLPAGSFDQHYLLVANNSPLLAMNNHPAWLANDSLSQWVGWSGDGTNDQPAGNFPISTSFSLDGFDPATATITMYLSTDNGVDDVLLNGISTGISCGSFNSWCGPYTINSGFITGTNKLEFKYRNDGTSANPAGFRVRMSGTAAESLSNTQLASCPQTSYYRHEFTYTPTDNTAVTLELNGAIDDGAVFYLNGQELYRQNMPTGPVTFATKAQTNLTAAPAQFGPVIVPADNLIAGNNVLAAEVHQATNGINDLYFQARLTAIETPIPPDSGMKLAFNEIAPGTTQFWLELVNYGQEAVDLYGSVVSVNGQTNADYTLPHLILNKDQFLTLNSSVLGFTPAPDDKLYLYLPGREILADAVIVSDQLQGRQLTASGRWAYPDTATPGSTNTFAINNDIVINEIMYHKGDLPGTPAQYATTTLVTKGASARVIVPQASIGTGWTGGSEPFDDSAWTNTTTGIGYDTAPDYLSDIEGNIYDQIFGIRSTFYTRIAFENTGTGPISNMILQMKYDDGFIVYLNGIRIAQQYAPSDPTWNSVASGSHESYGYESFDVSAYISALKPGTNILAIHGLNYGSSSSDLIILPQLTITQEITPALPPSESDQEWVELYNRGISPVDLTDWKLDGDISYSFASNTVIAPGAYLVITRNRTEMTALWPGSTIIGDFSGRLSNSAGNVILLDSMNNITDEVQYYDDLPWPANADGYHASLELCNPLADNNSAQSWYASNELAKSSWQTYTYRSIANSSSVSAPDGQWREFILGMLDAGELLIDDISVVEDPDGAATQLLSNGNFEATPGLNSWRILGNHRHSEVITDPANSANHVLRLLATGSTDHMHNHIETTLANGKSITNGTTYQISFRARWISGSNQLNTRGYFTRLAKTTLIARPQLSGTPGTINTCYIANPGPVFDSLSHTPAVPGPDENITVSAHITDPSGVAAANLFWRLNGQTWNSVPMTCENGSEYFAVIPSQIRGSVVQFYLSATDYSGALADYPQGGPDSHAMFRVNDGLAATNGLHNLRILTTSEDNTWLHSEINVMSNDRVGATVIYDESEVFYNVGIRLKGSQHHRTPSNEVGFNIGFNADELFRGVHKTIAVDRSEGVGFGQREIMINQAMNHAATTVSKYSDLVKVMPLLDEHTSTAEIQLARFNDEFLNSKFENGSDGYLYEYELVYFPLTTNNGAADGYKLPLPDYPIGTSITNLGEDKEQYRHLYLSKNNRSQDSYETLMAFCARFGDSSESFYNDLTSFIDVDVWLESFATATASGSGDNYGGDNAYHNAMLYVRPSDNRVLYFPHDLDYAYDQYRPLVPNSDLAKIIAKPQWQRLYYGYLYHMLTSSYNPAYMAHWSNHFGSLLAGQNFDSHLSFIAGRYNYLMSEIGNQVAPDYGFAITDTDSVVASDHIVINGKAWINVKTIRLQGLDGDLDTTWTKQGSGNTTQFFWQATVPLAPGINNLVFQAIGFKGEVIGQGTINITSTVQDRPLHDFLRVSEIMYDPQGGTDYEFIELTNIGTEILNISPVNFTEGIEFSFASSTVTSIAPGGYVVIAKNKTKFISRYGSSGITIAGEFTGKLSNEGETITMTGRWNATICSFAFSDGRGWPLAAAGAGHSLVRDYSYNGSDNHGLNWRASSYMHGSPGKIDPAISKPVVLNEIMANTDYSDPAHPGYDSNDWIELYNPNAASSQLGSGWYLSDDKSNLKKWAIPAVTVPALGRISFDEVTGFHNPITAGFGLDKTGESAFLSYLPGNSQDRIVDCTSFLGQDKLVSLGRIPDGGIFWQATQPTRNNQNLAQSPGIVISEIMYNPADGLYEYIELYNTTNTPISLWDSQLTRPWQLDGGIAFTFNAASIVPAHGCLLIVPFDPAGPELTAFVSQYGQPVSAVAGPYTGGMAGNGERLTLEKPGADLSWVIVDEVIYSDRDPWPVDADGTGSALWRLNTFTSGNNPAAWSTALPGPGATACDLNADGTVNLLDWSLLASNWLTIPQQNEVLPGDIIRTQEAGIDMADLNAFLQLWLTSSGQ